MQGSRDQLQIRYEKEVNHLKNALRKARDLRSGALSQKELLEQQREKLYQKAVEYGVKPEELGTKIELLKKEIERLLAEAQKLIPWDLLEKGNLK